MREETEDAIEMLVKAIIRIMGSQIHGNEGSASSFLFAQDIAKNGKEHILKMMKELGFHEDLQDHFEFDFDDQASKMMRDCFICYFWESKSLQDEFRYGGIASQNGIKLWESDEEEYDHSRIITMTDSAGGEFDGINEDFKGEFKERELTQSSRIGILISVFGWDPDSEIAYDRNHHRADWNISINSISSKALKNAKDNCPEALSGIPE